MRRSQGMQTSGTHRRILFTDYRRPLKTFKTSFLATIGLYFFKETFA